MLDSALFHLLIHLFVRSTNIVECFFAPGVLPTVRIFLAPYSLPSIMLSGYFYASL